MSIITYPLNGITYDADDVQTYLCTRTSGVYASEDCFDISITDDMEVTIGTGLAWIKNGDFAGKSICMDESAALTISLGSGSYGRIDRIVLKFDTEENESTLEVLEGTPSSSPTAEEIEQDETVYELCLYEISVPAGTTELSAALITDTRTDEELCGLMRDGVTTIPTATLQAAAEELIEKLKTDIEAVEDGSAYMLSTVYDEKGGAKQVAFEEDIGDLVENYLPFSLAIVDEDYGYYDTDGEFHPFRNPTGNATAAQLLSGYVASNATTEDFSGTMNNWGSNTVTMSSNTATLSAGYYSGITINAASRYTAGYNSGYSVGYAVVNNSITIHVAGSCSASNTTNGVASASFSTYVVINAKAMTITSANATVSATANYWNNNSTVTSSFGTKTASISTKTIS